MGALRWRSRSLFRLVWMGSLWRHVWPVTLWCSPWMPRSAQSEQRTIIRMRLRPERYGSLNISGHQANCADTGILALSSMGGIGAALKRAALLQDYLPDR